MSSKSRLQYERSILFALTIALLNPLNMVALYKEFLFLDLFGHLYTKFNTFELVILVNAVIMQFFVTMYFFEKVELKAYM